MARRITIGIILVAFIFLWTLGNYGFITGFLLGCLSSGTSYMVNVLVCDNGFQLGLNKSEVEDDVISNN